MDKLIEEAKKIPQCGEYKLADWLQGYRNALALIPTDTGYKIIPLDGWEPSPYNVERQFLIPYRVDLTKILGRLK